jgi:2Fe-2S ferredoxin
MRRSVNFAQNQHGLMYTIKFNFEQKGVEPLVIENVAAGQSILEVALDNNIELHHNCGMVCACSTCHLYLEKGAEYVPEISDREEDFIDRARNPRINSRLGCQCVLEDDADGAIEVTIPDQSVIHGE